MPGHAVDERAAVLLVAILLHASVDTASSGSRLFPSPSALGALGGEPIGSGAAALLIIVLTRGRPGHRPGQARTSEQPRGGVLAAAAPAPAAAD